MNQVASCRRARGPRRRGTLLLEALIALAIFLGAAAFAIGAMRQGLSAAESGRDRDIAVDLAATAMAGLATETVAIADLGEGWLPEDADPTWADRFVVGVDTERTEWTGLTLVTVTVTHPETGASEAVLRELLRLNETEADADPLDDIMDDLPVAEPDDGGLES